MLLKIVIYVIAVQNDLFTVIQAKDEHLLKRSFVLLKIVIYVVTGQNDLFTVIQAIDEHLLKYRLNQHVYQNILKVLFIFMLGPTR